MSILRKNEVKEKREELFVFGYSCKLFRDDGKALLIDQGKHLIPWMGDETLKIDRYDARGALHDLTSHEAPQGGYDWRVELTKAEYDVEQLCDEERYRALHTDEDEEEMYKEEELKRLHAAGYGQVGFNYEATSETESLALPIEIDEPFVPTTSFKDMLPPNIILPESLKQNAIIEKTAKFIAMQGAQMEILIKAKQRDNPQFQFLNKDSPLHLYYVALIGLLKAEKWPEKEPENVPEKPPEDEEYLHPTLSSTVIELAPSIPSIHYKPSADCDYTLLISKMRGEATLDEPYTPELAPGEVAPPGTEPLPLRKSAEISRAPVMYNQTQDCGSEGDQHQSNLEYQKQYAAYYYQYMAQAQAAQEVQNKMVQETQRKDLNNHQSPSVVVGKSTGLSLMNNYNTDSDSDSESEVSNETKNDTKETMEIPPDVKEIIDKMAAYVARNGDKFEEIVLARNDPRFTFLEPDNVFHLYYKRLMQQKREIDMNGIDQDKKSKGNLVSFSIKKMKEPDPILPKPALPYESSSDEDSDKETDNQNQVETKQEVPKSNILQVYPTVNIPPVMVYKVDNTVQNNVTKKVEEVLLSNSTLGVDLDSKVEVKNLTIKNIESENTQLDVDEVPLYKPEKKGNEFKRDSEKGSHELARIYKEENESSVERSNKNKEIEISIENRRRKHEHEIESESYRKKERDNDSPSYRREKRKHREKKIYNSERERKSMERENKRDREKEQEKKKLKPNKIDVETEIISLVDNSDELIDLTGDISDTKVDLDPEVEKQKQIERRRRAAEFLKRAGVDPQAAATLPNSSLASAMVDTLESMRKKKELEEEKRRRRREKRTRERHEYEFSHRKSKRRKHRSSDEEDSECEGSRRRKHKKDKKTKGKKRKRKTDEDQESFEDHPLNIDLTSTLKGLRTSSPTKELCLPEVEDSQQKRSTESSSDEEMRRDRKKKRKDKKDREYSEGEWSSDSEDDSKSSNLENDK